jgi:hypothetical protein
MYQTRVMEVNEVDFKNIYLHNQYTSRQPIFVTQSLLHALTKRTCKSMQGARRPDPMIQRFGTIDAKWHVSGCGRFSVICCFDFLDSRSCKLSVHHTLRSYINKTFRRIH